VGLLTKNRAVAIRSGEDVDEKKKGRCLEEVANLQPFMKKCFSQGEGKGRDKP